MNLEYVLSKQLRKYSISTQGLFSFSKIYGVTFYHLKFILFFLALDGFRGFHSIKYTGLTKSAISTQHLAILSIVDVALIVDTTNLWLEIFRPTYS